jgi:hypothetical protein
MVCEYLGYIADSSPIKREPSDHRNKILLVSVTRLFIYNMKKIMLTSSNIPVCMIYEQKGR